LSKFLLQLWSQIYTPPAIIPRHAPPSRVHRLHQLQPPEAQATSVIGLRHAPESLLLFGARVGYAPPFLAVHGVGWGLRWSILCWVVPVTARVLHAPPSPAESATAHCRQLLWVFSVLISLYIPLCLLWITVCLFVMHKCSWTYLVSGVD
jgi:hypothetical protein